jgi:hypothetical protein
VPTYSSGRNNRQLAHVDEDFQEAIVERPRNSALHEIAARDCAVSRTV